MESIGTCSLVVDNGYVLDLERTFYMPSFSRNMIYVSRLVPLEYSFMFSDYTFSLFCKSELIENDVLSNGLFSINLQYNAVLHTHIGNKRCIMNGDSSILWHRRLRHISIDRIKRLVNDKVLNTLDFTDFNTCIDCIKGKHTCDAPFPGGPLITRQPAEYSWMSGNPTPLMKIEQSLLCTGSSTQNTTCPNHMATCPNILQRPLLRLFRMPKLFPSVGTKVVKHYTTVEIHRSFPQGVVFLGDP